MSNNKTNKDLKWIYFKYNNGNEWVILREQSEEAVKSKIRKAGLPEWCEKTVTSNLTSKEIANFTQKQKSAKANEVKQMIKDLYSGNIDFYSTLNTLKEAKDLEVFDENGEKLTRPLKSDDLFEYKNSLIQYPEKGYRILKNTNNYKYWDGLKRLQKIIARYISNIDDNDMYNEHLTWKQYFDCFFLNMNNEEFSLNKINK